MKYIISLLSVATLMIIVANIAYCQDIKVLLKRAESGDVAAQADLGEYYYKNEQYKEARTWYEKAAGQGNPKAVNGMGLMHTFKQGGLPAWHGTAANYYMSAARHGYTEAKYNLGYLLEHTADKTLRNFCKAKEWYQKAIDDGYPQAMFAMGKLYDRGRCGEVNVFKATEWFEKAAKYGNAEAQYELGFNYFNGVGADKDKSKGLEYFGLACDNGLDKACEKYAHIKKENPDSISERWK